MIISGDSQEQGSHYQTDAARVDKQFIEEMSKFDIDDDELKKMIYKLNISADAKHLIYKFADATILAGKFIIKIGRKIIDFVCKMYAEYPNVTFGLIFGAIAGILVSSIPILGVVLGPIFTPLAMLLGLVVGGMQDIRDKNLLRRIAEINTQFQPLKS